uniref:Uncharacterized protein n=1 Tax=Romanomermis culicivorax TaxID=13658 RepID=A0A915L873_ROMCU
MDIKPPPKEFRGELDPYLLHEAKSIYNESIEFCSDIEDYGSPEENCNRALKALRNNPTVRTLFEATKKIKAG